MRENADKDWVSLPSLKRGSDLFQADSREDEFIVPLSVSPHWRRGLNVSEMALCGAGMSFQG